MRDKVLDEIIAIKNTIKCVLDRNLLGVLATQLDGQPHASLIAFTPLEYYKFIAFATFRNTLKYRSIQKDSRVAILVEDRNCPDKDLNKQLVITAVGEVVKIPDENKRFYLRMHLERHPHLENFLTSPECELVIVSVRAYQVVKDIDDVQWYSIEQLE